MHEIIQYISIISCLDTWWVAASKHFKKTFDSLDEFATLEPTWEDILELLHHLCGNYISWRTDQLSSEKSKPAQNRNQQQENVCLQQQYFLLHKEISYMMNHSDIGWVESLFMPWIFIFWGCGKHKYAAEVRRYLENVHFVYPEGLQCSTLHTIYGIINLLKKQSHTI